MLKKLRDLAPTTTCEHAEHNPPSLLGIGTGTFEYTCPGCRQITVFTIYGPFCVIETIDGGPVGATVSLTHFKPRMD